MGKYFGPLRNSDIDTFASDAFAHETHNLPRAYVGRNKFLMATIDFLITKDDDWYTRHILPWLYTEEIHVKWNIWRFNRTMMDYEPEQGVPRYVSYESESRSDSLVRRGLAFIIEHGFYKTEIGRQHYLMNLKQIVEAVHETVYFGVMHELLAAPNYYLQWQQKHGKTHTIVSNDAVNMLAEERWRFACVQKDVKGLFVLDAEIKDRMRRVGIEPTAWIFPSKMAIYASMVPEYFNEYNRGGAPATSALEVGAKRFDTFRGNRVFETRSFDTDFMANGSIEPLVRHREIGEYYVLGDHFHDFTHGIRIFDMARDKFHTITYGTAFDEGVKGETHTGADAGTVQQLCHYYVNKRCENVRDALRHAFDNQKSTDDYVNMANHIHGFGVPVPGAPVALAAGAAGAAAAAAALAAAALAGIAVPIGEDPTQGFSRECYEFCQLQRRRNGAPLYPEHFNCEIQQTQEEAEWGADDVDMGMIAAEIGNINDIIHAFKEKKRVSNFRGAALPAGGPAERTRGRFLLVPHKMLLMRPRQTYRMATAILVKGGEELGQTLHGHHDFQLTDDVIHKTHIGHYTFYSKSVVREPKNMHLAEDVYCTGYEGGENTKFIKEDDAGTVFAAKVEAETASIISICVAYDEPLNPCISLIGDLSEHGLTTRLGDSEGSYSTSQVMKNQFRDQISSTPETAYVADDRDEVGANGVLFRGAEHGYNDKTHGFAQRQHNTGHWGANVYDGCAPVRLGMYAHLKQM
jgi:hypothetical protein